MKSVAIYARVSTIDQSAESQLTALREFVSKREFLIYREYVDQVTGVIAKRKAGKRTQYEALMADAKQRKFDVVLVWKFDRFARSLHTLIDALQLFEALGIDFISSTQGIDTTTPMGRFFFHNVGAFAELEREMIVERVKNGLDNARANGVKLGRPRSHPPVVEQDVMERFRLGDSCGKIAKEMKMPRASVWVIIQRLNGLASSGVGASTEGGSVRPGGGL